MIAVFNITLSAINIAAYLVTGFRHNLLVGIFCLAVGLLAVLRE